MRTINFRDGVLWPIARKIGYEPTNNELSKDRAISIVTFVNSWVRKLWDSADFPDWTEITPRTPIVTVDGTADDNNRVEYEPDPNGPDAGDNPLGRVLKVYLNDPRTTPGPLETQFKLRRSGVDIGFDHGTKVWIKHVIRCPEFTSEEWRSDITYYKGGPTYSSISGECYKSLLDGNTGRDPSATPNPAPEVTQPFDAGNPTVPASPEIWQAKVSDPAWFDLEDTIYKFVIMKPDGSTGTVTYSTPAPGGTLPDLMTALEAAFAGSPNPFVTALTLTTDLIGNFRMEHATSAFSVEVTIFNADQEDPGPRFPEMKHLRAYNAGVTLTNQTPQITTLNLTELLEGIPATYELILIDSANLNHSITFEATSDLSMVDIMNGIIAAVNAEATVDPFWERVVMLSDFALFKFTFITIQKVDIQLDISSEILKAWELIPFPFALCEQVVAGAVADARNEEGQTDKAQVESKTAEAENERRISDTIAPDFNVLTDQSKQRSRYRVEVGV